MLLFQNLQLIKLLLYSILELNLYQVLFANSLKTVFMQKLLLQKALFEFLISLRGVVTLVLVLDAAHVLDVKLDRVFQLLVGLLQLAVVLVAVLEVVDQVVVVLVGLAVDLDEHTLRLLDVLHHVALKLLDKRDKFDLYFPHVSNLRFHLLKQFRIFLRPAL